MSAAPPASPPAYAGPDALRVDSGHLIAIGDTQETAWVELFMEQNRHLRPLLLAEVARRAPDGVLHMGDLVPRGSSARHWARLDAELAPLHARGTPLLPSSNP